MKTNTIKNQPQTAKLNCSIRISSSRNTKNGWRNSRKN